MEYDLLNSQVAFIIWNVEVISILLITERAEIQRIVKIVIHGLRGYLRYTVCNIVLYYKEFCRGSVIMRIAIVDDIKEERTLLHGWMLQSAFQKKSSGDIVEFESGEEFLLAAKERPFTVLFHVFIWAGANGIEIAKELRKTDADCLLIFTTTSTDHALEGFRVRALHYLVKPYNEREISTLMDEILARIPDSGKYIDVKVNGSNIQIPFKNIIYAEHFSHMIYIHTTGGKELVTRQSFEMFTASLKMDTRFYLCSRGVVINLEHAVDFDGTMFLMDDNSNISVSRKLTKMPTGFYGISVSERKIKMMEMIRPNIRTYCYHPRHASCLSARKRMSEAGSRQTCFVAYPAAFDTQPVRRHNLLYASASCQITATSCIAASHADLPQNPSDFHLEIQQYLSGSLCCFCVCEQSVSCSKCYYDF